MNGLVTQRRRSGEEPKGRMDAGWTSGRSEGRTRMNEGKKE